MELLNLLQQSFINVTNGSNFWFWLGTGIASGAVVGGIFNQGLSGLRRSIFTISPLALLVTAATGDSVYAIHLLTPVGPNAFNSAIRLIILTCGYIFGLWYGHLIVSKAVRQVYKEHGIKHNRNILIEP
jgi:hypothetical protein